MSAGAEIITDFMTGQFPGRRLDRMPFAWHCSDHNMNNRKKNF